MKPTRKRVTRLMAFGPALVVLCVTAYVASGASVVGSASAVSTAGVNATVSATGSTDPDMSDASCNDEKDVDGEQLAANWETNGAVTAGCIMSFWSNNGSGASVNYKDDYFADTPAAFFCFDPAPGGAGGAGRDCSVDNKRADNVGGDKTMAASSDEFGIALKALGGGGSPQKGTGAENADATPLITEAIWWPITDSDQELCETTAPNTSGTAATCDFVFGGVGEGATQAAGSYYGRALFSITQNP